MDADNYDIENNVERGWVLGLAALGSFVVVMDFLVVVTALSAIQRDLGAGIEQLEWTVNAYTLSFAILLMTAAALGDRFGRRRGYIFGLVLFAVSSAGCALAPDIGWLIAARVVQGVGAATVMPLALALLNHAYPPARRGRALGVYGSITGLAAVLGPIVGGALTEGIAWQWIFWLNVPIGLLAVPLVLRHVPETRGPATPLDSIGLVLVSGAAFGLVWGLSRGNSVGWGSPEILVALAGGLVLAAAFVGWELRSRAPMLPMRLFRSRRFSAGNVAVFALNATMTAGLFFMAQFGQVVQGLGALGAGLQLLPWGIMPILIGFRSGRLADTLGERPLIITGVALQFVGTAWIALVSGPQAGYLALVVPMIISGAGFAFAIPAVTKAVVGAVAPADIGRASGTFTTIRQLGGAFGVAIAVAAFSGAGGYASPAQFSSGFVAAFASLAALSLVGTIVSLAVPVRTRTEAVSSDRATTRP